MVYWLAMVIISESDPLSCRHVLEYLRGGNNVTACTRSVLSTVKRRRHTLPCVYSTGGYSSIGHRVVCTLTNEIFCQMLIKVKSMVAYLSLDISMREFTK